MSFPTTLIKATKSIHQCLENCEPGAPAEARWIARGMRISCQTLGDLIIDPQLLQFIRDERRSYSVDEAIPLLESMRENRQLLEEFLEAEQDLFNRAGLPSSASNHLVESAREVVISGRFHERREITEELVGLKRYVCNSADRLDSSRRKGVVRGMRDVVGGLATVTLNGGLLAASVGITGAMSGASMMVGGAIASNGVSTIRQKL